MILCSPEFDNNDKSYCTSPEINDVDSAGNSAVHFAAGYGKVKILEHLLARGAAVSKVRAPRRLKCTDFISRP